MIFKMTSVHQIKDRLLSVIDEDGSVLNSSAALEIVIMLEKTAVTKDELEETRLGKYINIVRRAATDHPSLQKRAKKLIKTWQQMVQEPQKKSLESSHTKTAPLRSSTPTSAFAKNKHSITARAVNGDSELPNNAKRKHEANSSKSDKSEAKSKQSTKSRRLPSKPKTSTTSDSNQSFTCMTNGLKLKITSLPSPTPTKDKPFSSKVPEDKVRLKRKFPEDVADSPKTSFSTRTESPNETKFQTTVVEASSSSQRSSPFKNNKNINDRNRTHTGPLESNQTALFTASDNITENACSTLNITETDNSSTDMYGSAIVSPNSLHDTIDRRSGVDGCRVNNGAWYSWADSLLIRHENIDIPSDESDILNILPYVELD